MESKWLEDFVSLAETGSFSRSAVLRHVTQPAFSRRIQSLEAWVGVALIDRTSYPTKLTRAGEVFYEQAVDMLSQLNTSRALMRGQGSVSTETIDIAVPHTLSFVFVPQWIKDVEERLESPLPLRARLQAGNVHDAVLALVESSCDLLICYWHDRLPVQLDPNRYEMKVLSLESVSPYARPGLIDRSKAARGPSNKTKPTSTKRAKDPWPFLTYSANAYLGRVVDLIHNRLKPNLMLDTIYETDMAEGLKMMALQGRGVAWLPDGLVAREVRSRALERVVVHPWDQELREQLEIRVYRLKPAFRPGLEVGAKPILDAIWAVL